MDPFISTVDLEAYLGEDVDELNLLTQIALDSACQKIRSYLGQTINLVRGDIETHDGTGRESILLRQLPVIDVVSVTEDDVELVPDDDYVVDPTKGIIYRRSTTWNYGWSYGWSWPRRRQGIVVIYDHGWAITEADVILADSGDEPLVNRVPSDIRQVALELAAQVYQAPALTTVAAGAVTSETIGSYSYTTDTASITAAAAGINLSPEQMTSLDYYKPGA